MSYFQKHSHKQPPVYEPQNNRPSNPKLPKKPLYPPKNESQQNKNTKHAQYNELHIFNSNKSRLPYQSKPQEKPVKAIPERDLPSLMLEGENSMQELLNSSINQFTKYLSDRDPLEEQHQQLVAQNKDLRKTLDKLKIIIKQKLVSALSKQRQQLNAVMEDYVQLITKLLADKEELTSALEQLEAKASATEHNYQELLKSHTEAQNKLQELTKDREQHIAKTKQQIDDFLQIIDQYEEEADQEGKENGQLLRKVAELEQQLIRARKSANKVTLPQKTQDLLELLERSQEQNKNLRAQFNQEKEALEKEHQEEFVEYERAMQETISKKDECISHLKTIIDNMRGQRSRDRSFCKSGEREPTHQ